MIVHVMDQTTGSVRCTSMTLRGHVQDRHVDPTRGRYDLGSIDPCPMDTSVIETHTDDPGSDDPASVWLLGRAST